MNINIKFLYYGLAIMLLVSSCEKIDSLLGKEVDGSLGLSNSDFLVDSIVFLYPGATYLKKKKTSFLYDSEDFVSAKIDSSVYGRNNLTTDTTYVSYQSYSLIGNRAYINGGFVGYISYGNIVIPRELDSPYAQYSNRNLYPGLSGVGDTSLYKFNTIRIEPSGRLNEIEFEYKYVGMITGTAIPTRSYLSVRQKKTYTNDEDGVVSVLKNQSDRQQVQQKFSAGSDWTLKTADCFKDRYGINTCLNFTKSNAKYVRSPYKQKEIKYRFYYPTETKLDRYFLTSYEEIVYKSNDSTNWIPISGESLIENYDGYILEDDKVKVYNIRDQNFTLKGIVKYYYRKKKK